MRVDRRNFPPNFGRKTVEFHVEIGKIVRMSCISCWLSLTDPRFVSRGVEVPCLGLSLGRASVPKPFGFRGRKCTRMMPE